MSSLRTLLAILKGEAVVLIKKSEHKADVLVGKNVDNVEYMHNYYLKEVKGNAEICKRKNYSGERKAS